MDFAGLVRMTMGMIVGRIMGLGLRGIRCRGARPGSAPGWICQPVADELDLVPDRGSPTAGFELGPRTARLLEEVGGERLGEVLKGPVLAYLPTKAESFAFRYSQPSSVSLRM